MKYKDFEIEKWSSGFQVVPGSLNIVASFIIKKENFAAGFAFRVGYLDWVAKQLKEIDLMPKIEEIIKGYIDKGQVKSLDEFTFEYHSSEFTAVDNPKWWIKSK